MKYSLIAFLALFFNLSFAQDLYVSTGSYVFVDGTGFTSGPTAAPLYVTNEIELANDGNIYLRNEAQLIQGIGTITSINSGEGQLSVYQEGTVNQWAYNYWCSPVGNNSATTGNEDARVQLLKDATNIVSADDPLGLTSWAEATFIAGLNGIASPLTISNRWLWTYETSSLYADWNYVGATGNISPGLGFTMKGSGTGTTGSTKYDFRGKPNNGTITNPVSFGDFTLVGNPYPSAIDSAAFIHDLDNTNEILGTIFYWEQDASVGSHFLADYIGGYHEFTIDPTGTIISNTFAQFETYDSAGNSVGIPPGPPGGTKQARRYIPIAQGFMVEGLVGITNTVTVKNSHRRYEKEGVNSYFFRNNDLNVTNSNSNQGIQYQENGLSIIPSDYKRFRINADFTVSEKQYTRQLLLNFHDDASMSHDRGLELHRSDNLNSDAYFVQEEDIFSGLAFPFTEDLKIPLVIDIEQQQPLRFRIFDIQNFEESQAIYIHDIENDIYVNLRNQDYDLNIQPGNYTDRFEIVFTTEGALDIATFDTSTLIINQNNSIHELSVRNPKGLDVTSIEVYDVSGKRLLQNSYTTVSNRYELSTSNLSDGVYIVNVLSKSNNAIKSQKIIVKN